MQTVRVIKKDTYILLYVWIFDSQAKVELTYFQNILKSSCAGFMTL